jgi:hypothetical protein
MLNEFASPLYEGKKKKQNDLCISGYIALVSSKCLPPSKHVSRFARYGSWTDLRRPTFAKDWSRVSGASATEKKGGFCAAPTNPISCWSTTKPWQQ